MRWLRRAGVVVAVLALSACGLSEYRQPDAPQPRDGQAGLQVTGTVSGRQVAVSDGYPLLLVGDCEWRLGIPAAVCVRSRDLTGSVVAVGFANPSALVDGAALEVAHSPCRSQDSCDAVAGHAVVDVLVAGQRVRAVGGRLRIDAAVPAERYAGEFTLRLPAGRLSGRFDVVPRPDDA